jgi:exopolysaccharide biosynthesis polyprenyl glycosylphosphotransferase
MCAHFRIYTLPRTLRLRCFASALLPAATTWIVAYTILAYLLRSEQPVSRIYIALAYPLVIIALLAWRHGFQKVAVKAAIAGKLRQRILVIDWSDNAAALIEAMTQNEQHVYEIAGCVSPSGAEYAANPPARVRRLGSWDSVPGLLHDHAIDLVIMAGLNPPDEDMARLADLCEKELVQFKVIPSCFQILVSGLHLESVSGVPVLGLSRLPLDNPFNLALKRVVDVIGASFGLLLSAPVIGLFSLLVRRESPGPVFYRQRRLGRDGSPFWIYKIRSMRLNAEQGGKVGWSTRDDPRRLRIGGFMRRWNIDELPQFWNVLKGEMSLVGPRPERPELIINFKEDIPHYNARHSIKPGMTGWAQVHGLRGDTDLTQRIRHDLYYVENWHALLDFQIMLLTLFRYQNAG